MSISRILVSIYLSLITFLFFYYCISYISVWLEILELEKVELMSLYNNTIKDNEIILQKLALVDISSIYHQVCFYVFKNTYNLDYDTAIFVYKYKLLTEAQLLEIQQLIDLRDYMFVKKQLHEELQQKKEEQRSRLISIIYLGCTIASIIRILFGDSYSSDSGSSAPDTDTNPEIEIIFYPSEDFDTLFPHHDDSIPNNNKSLSDDSIPNNNKSLSDDSIPNNNKSLSDDSLESLEPFEWWS